MEEVKKSVKIEVKVGKRRSVEREQVIMAENYIICKVVLVGKERSSLEFFQNQSFSPTPSGTSFGL